MSGPKEPGKIRIVEDLGFEFEFVEAQDAPKEKPGDEEEEPEEQGDESR